MFRLQISFGRDSKPPKPHEIMSMLSSVVTMITSIKQRSMPSSVREDLERVTMRDPLPGSEPSDTIDDRYDEDDDNALPASCWSWSSFSQSWTRLSNGGQHQKDVVLACIRPVKGRWLWESSFLLDDEELVPMLLHEAAKAADLGLFSKGLIAKEQIHDWRKFASQEPELEPEPEPEVTEA